ncbi:hypothetical protein KR018_009515 [Drosophila ironensis]|nr:hypothetical protein KR018_009515 [Drosophila ironensis]
MSTDNPTQLRDLSQLRGQLQGTATAAVASTAHGYRSLAAPPPANSNTNSNRNSNINSNSNSNGNSNSITSVPTTSSTTVASVIANMPTSGSKYVFLQPNHNGGFTAYDGSSAAVAAPGNSATAAVGGATGSGSGTAPGPAPGGNIVLLAAEPLEMGSADALAAAAAAAGVNVRTTDGGDDGELRSLSWLNDSNLIKGIVTTSGQATGAASTGPQVKRGTAVALKTSTPGAVCIVSDLIEEMTGNEHSTSAVGELEHPAAAAAAAAGAVYSTTTVHKGPSGTTTVVEYKASKANNQQQQQQPPQQQYQRTTLGHSYVPAAALSSPAKTQPAAVQQQQQPQQQIYVTSNGSSAFKAAVAALKSPTNNTTPSSTPSTASNSTTTHHPHKKYLREKMHVQMDHSSHVASTVTVVSSPATSNNSSISSASNSINGSVSGSGSASSTAAVNGGNSPVPKSSFSSVFEAINYTTTITCSPPNLLSNNGQPSDSVPTSTVVISAASLPPGFSFVNHVASTPHVISTPAHAASPETPPGAALLPGAYYSTTCTASIPTSNTNTAIRSLQLSVTPPPTSMTPTGHNGSVSGSGSGSGGGVGLGNSNLRSPNSYASYENEDSLKDFDVVVTSRMHTSTPQYAGGGGKVGGGASNGYSTNTPQKQKHPNNVPYDPLVHTNNKPPYSFSSLIFMAIEGSNEKALPVKEIYAWIVQHFPYFKTAPNGWKNSVRHNLSLNKSFVKVEKAPNMGKGSLWRVEPQQRQNLIQALNRSPFFSNSAVDKISPALKSPNAGAQGGVPSAHHIYSDSLDGSGNGSSLHQANGGVAAVSLSTPTKSNGLVMANGASQSQNAAMPHSPGGGAAGAAGGGSHARFDPKLFPNLSKAFRNIRDETAGQPQLLQDVLEDGDYHNNNISSTNNNNTTSNGVKYNFAGLNGATNGNASSGGNNASGPSDGSINFERLARDCGADSMDDVHAAAAMLFLKHGPKAFSEPYQNGSAPVITSSPSEDHTYSAGGNSNADSGASTPLTNGNVLAQAAVQAVVQGNPGSAAGGSDSNCASSDAAYDSSEENHNITPEELADQQRHRDGVDALLSLSRSSAVECGSVATTHYHSNGSGSGSGSSHGSPHKRASSHSLEEEHREQLVQQQQQQQHLQHHHHYYAGTQQGIYTNGSGSKMALLSSAAANVAQLQQDFFSGAGLPGGGGGGATNTLYLPAMVAAAVASHKKGKPLRGLRTKVKRKAAWMR